MVDLAIFGHQLLHLTVKLLLHQPGILFMPLFRDISEPIVEVAVLTCDIEVARIAPVDQSFVKPDF